MHRLLIPNLILVLLLSASSSVQADFQSAWPPTLHRTWVGPEYWANRLQDWQIVGGRLECLNPRMARRTVHLLTHRIAPRAGKVRLEVRTGLIDPQREHAADCETGFLVGAGAPDLDVRAAALVQMASGPDGGWFAGLNGEGRLVLRDNSEPNRPRTKVSSAVITLDDVVLSLTVQTDAAAARLALQALDAHTRDVLGEVSCDDVAPRALQGNLALSSHPGAERGSCFWFRDWRVSGSQIDADASQLAGPILCAQYTLSEGVLKMTAQLMPIGSDDGQTVILETQRAGQWKEVARTRVVYPGFTAPLRVEPWDATRDTPYRLRYELTTSKGKQRCFWQGIVRRDPVDKTTICVAGFTGNHNCRHGFGRKGYPWNANALWFPHQDLVDRVRQHDPDLLFFSGDQVYEGGSPTYADRSGYDNSYLDYLYKWYLWCWAFGDLARDRPCICIPDDHDVYQGNLWGQGGRKSPDRDHDGGYVLPAEFVRMVERTQTSHLPDPFDPTPIEQGIGVYYTSMTYGRISLAILEDRKFKSGCHRDDMPPGNAGRPDHYNTPDLAPQTLDVPGVKLLGDRQLRFLEAWTQDWRGADMKMALSQTVFANLATHHGGGLQRLMADLDSNGWPQTGRNQALAALRKGFTFHLAGDQHLATIVHHGIDEHNDAIWSFCVPSIANFYPRAYAPENQGKYSWPAEAEFTGPRRDGLGNLVNVYAATNPGRDMGHAPKALHDNMPGYGIVRLNKQERTIRLECWPRFADPGDPAARLYDGWPRTISQLDNYARKPAGYLGHLKISGLESPVVQVVNEASGEVVYTLRIRGTEFSPMVFDPGSYKIKIWEPGTAQGQVLHQLRPQAKDQARKVTVSF